MDGIIGNVCSFTLINGDGVDGTVLSCGDAFIQIKRRDNKIILIPYTSIVFATVV